MFLQLLILRWSYRPRAPLGDSLPTFLSGYWASSLGCAWLSCLQLQPAHSPEVTWLTRRPSWFGGCHRTPCICRNQTVFHCLIRWCEGLCTGRRCSCRRTPLSLRAWWMRALLRQPIYWSNWQPLLCTTHYLFLWEVDQLSRFPRWQMVTG